MMAESIVQSITSWPEVLKRLHRLHVLCELCPEIRSGEQVRASADMTGVGDILPPQIFSLDAPRIHRIFLRDVFITIWNLCLRLNDEVKSDQVAEHLQYVCQSVLMLNYFTDGEPSESNREMLVNVIMENHKAILDEMGMEVPDPEDSHSVRDAIERLLWKHAKKALNAYRRNVLY